MRNRISFYRHPLILFYFFEKEKDNKRDKESIKNPISKYMFTRRLTDTKHNLAYFLPDLRKIASQIKLF